MLGSLRACGSCDRLTGKDCDLTPELKGLRGLNGAWPDGDLWSSTVGEVAVWPAICWTPLSSLRRSLWLPPRAAAILTKPLSSCWRIWCLSKIASELAGAEWSTLEVEDDVVRSDESNGVTEAGGPTYTTSSSSTSNSILSWRLFLRRQSRSATMTSASAARPPTSPVRLFRCQVAHHTANNRSDVGLGWTVRVGRPVGTISPSTSLLALELSRQVGDIVSDAAGELVC